MDQESGAWAGLLVFTIYGHIVVLLSQKKRNRMSDKISLIQLDWNALGGSTRKSWSTWPGFLSACVYLHLPLDDLIY